MIVGKMNKKMQKFDNEFVKIISYDKQEYSKDDYPTKEFKKSMNIHSICYCIRDIIHYHEPDLIQMEGISYGSRGSSALADLAGLSFAIRMSLLDESNLQFNIIAPTAVKKFAVGNGSAEKDVIIASWKKLDKNVTNISEIKLDDLADSYFISHYRDHCD
jgi:Holliday junction resolvasome RuvABC endonuclease subunit